MRRLLLALALTLLPSVASAEDGRVLVQAELPHRGTMADIVTAYGTAGPALDGGMTLSVQQEGRITGIAVTPGEAVKAGARLIDFGASAAASSIFQQAISALALARTERGHTAQLLAQQLATRDQLATADKAVSDAQASLDALRRDGADKPVRSLTAPFDGIVAAIPVAQGDRVQPGAPLLTLTRLDGLVVTVGLELSDRRRVQPGQKAALVSLSAGAAPPLDASVLRVDGVLNPKTRLIDADLSIPIGAVVSGEGFRADIETGRIAGWLLPHDAVLTDDQGAFLFQVDGEKAARVAVKILGTGGDTDVIDGQLDPARKVVVSGAYQLTDGAALHEDKP